MSNNMSNNANSKDSKSKDANVNNIVSAQNDNETPNQKK